MARQRHERIYRYFLWVTKRMSDRQMMILLAAIVGLCAGIGTYLFELLLYWIRAGLVNWFPVERAHFLYLIYPAIGIIIATHDMHIAQMCDSVYKLENHHLVRI